MEGNIPRPRERIRETEAWIFKWSGELNGVSARADEHPEVQDGICEGGGGKLWYVFGEVAVELALSFWCGAENLCFESVDVEVAG